MKNLKSLTVGIAAFNEEANISYLLKDLLEQKLSKLYLKKIIVCSDGSTDNTVRVARSFKDKRVRVLDNKNRAGKSIRINQMFKLAETDVFVLLDADILIKNSGFLEELTEPIRTNQADLVSSKLTPV